jgi:UDP-N-acetylmuramoyl-L-alanyl-D-glutamate--2,6-diaminopimelate ligase
MALSPHLDRGVSLRELFPEATFCGIQDVVATACCGDSRSCQPGDLFVAMMGRRDDGHDFYRQAIQRGATAVLADRPLPTGNIPLCLVPDTRAAYGRLCQALAGNPTEQLKVIGVTGTLGKTVTSCLIAGMLEGAGHRVGLLSTLGYCDGLHFEAAPVATPAPPVAAHWMARMATTGCTHAIIEATQRGLSSARLAGVALDVACITNVRRSADLVSWKRRQQLHSRLFDHLAPQAFAVLNVDDAGAADYLSELHCPVLTIGINQPAELMATLVERCPSEQTFLLTAGNETVPVRTAVIGDPHIYNCLTAAAVGLGYGLDLAAIVRGLEAIRRLPARLERIECGQPFSVFVDAARCVDGLTVALTTLREVTQGRLTCVVDVDAESARDSRPWLLNVAESFADQVFVSSKGSTDNLRRMTKTSDPMSEVRVVGDRSRAIEWALNLARPGDCVLLAGATVSPSPIGEGSTPDDQETARQWLHAHANDDAFACRQ